MNYLLKSLALALILTPATMDFASAQSVEGPANSVVFVSFSQNRELTGSVTELDELKVTTSFGEVNVPMSKIDGIKMNIGNDNSAVLAFKNGDMLSGKVNLDTVQLKTDWGTAHIDASQIETITTDKNARFFTDNTSGGSGWRFTKARPVPVQRGR
jgi:formylmethanofuran dehydrogenase subunit D